jgi:hypothetical protein
MDEVQLVGNWESRKYHLATCHYAREMDPKHRVTLKNHDEARLQKYSPCRACVGAGSKLVPSPSSVPESDKS